MGVLSLRKIFFHRNFVDNNGVHRKGRFRKSQIKWWIIIGIIIGLSIAMSLYHHDIIVWLEPKAKRLEAVPAGFLAPIGILVILSFPPLLGHEVVGILLGIVYGLWIGFAIFAAGTLLGEIIAFFCFKGCCMGYARKAEAKSMFNAALFRSIKDGGLWFAIVVRLSLVPGHVSTAFMAASDLEFWKFFLAAAITLPKQALVVYSGTIFNNPTPSSKSKIITYSVLALTVVLTVISAVYIWKQLVKSRAAILKEREEGVGITGEKADLEAGVAPSLGWAAQSNDTLPALPTRGHPKATSNLSSKFGSLRAKISTRTPAPTTANPTKTLTRAAKSTKSLALASVAKSMTKTAGYQSLN